MNLSTSEINSVLQSSDLKYQLNYLGTFPLDEMPSITRVKENIKQQQQNSPTGFIVNTDRGDSPGTHWFALAVPEDFSGLIFIEPMGLEKLLLASLEPLSRWCNEAVKKLKHRAAAAAAISTLPYPVQTLHSNLCGAYCGYILTKLKLYNNNLEVLCRREFATSAAVDTGSPSPHQLSNNDHRVASWWYKRREGLE